MRNINLLLLGLATFGSISISPALAQPVPATSTQPPLPKPIVPPTVAQPKVAPPRDQTEPPSTPAAPDTAAPPAEAPSDVPSPAVNSRAKGRNAGPIKPKADAHSAFVIGPEDVLAIHVWDEPGLSGSVTVGPDGMISMQLIHEVRAAGLTTSQLEAVLTKQFMQFRNNPDVNVQLIGVRSQKFLIQGAVGRPGTYPLTGPTPVLEALVNGAGFKEFANLKKIYILRTKPDGTVEKLNFNYKEVSHGRHMEQNILLKNGDQIFVPE